VIEALARGFTGLVGSAEIEEAAPAVAWGRRQWRAACLQESTTMTMTTDDDD